jgi:hypothetical protein
VRAARAALGRLQLVAERGRIVDLDLGVDRALDVGRAGGAIDRQIAGAIGRALGIADAAGRLERVGGAAWARTPPSSSAWASVTGAAWRSAIPWTSVAERACDSAAPSSDWAAPVARACAEVT